MMYKFDRMIGLGILAVICALAGSASGKPTSSEPLLKLYFIPFPIETYLPITKNNIHEQGSSIWFLEQNPFVSKLKTILQSRAAKRQVLPGHIRLKADFGQTSEVFFVDQKGTVLNEKTGATFALTVEQMSQLERDLDSFKGAVDVKALERRGGLNK
jgi:hypothetical protein